MKIQLLNQMLDYDSKQKSDNIFEGEEIIKQIKESKFLFNPFEILNIEHPKDAKAGFINKIQSKNITQRIEATLAFDQIQKNEPKRYLKVNSQKGYYKLNMQNYGTFEAALISDIQYLKKNINNKNHQFYQLKSTLLYICCRSGFYECVQLLLDCEIESEQDANSNLLDVASFYGHENVTKLLLSYDTNKKIKNIHENLPLNAARLDQIKQRITSNQDNKIQHLFSELKQLGLAEYIQRSKDDNMIRIYRKVKGVDIQQLFMNKTQYFHCYHGTKFQYLKPILDVGLQPSGAETKYGRVVTQDGHFQSNEEVDGIQNWSKAIFTSPSPFYAADLAFSERIKSLDQDYCCLVEALIKQDIQKQFKSTVLCRQFYIKNEPTNVEYRIEDAAKVIVISALFLKDQYLQDQDNYDECIKFLDNYNTNEL